jgi:outer membrane receptor protein involved in Fe transport
MITRRAASRRGLLSNTMLASAAAMTASLGLATVAVMPDVACAQDYTSGSLTGTVEDDAGAPVAGAKVTITSAQGATRETTTDADGAFRVPALAVGTYTVRVQAEGYSTAENAAVQVAPGGASYGFTLAAGDLGEVVVTGSRRQRDFNRTDTGLSVDVQETAERVPVGRSIASVIQLAPGSGFPDPSIQGNGVRRNQSVVTLSGASAAENVYYINGLNVTDQRTFLGYSDLPFEAIRTLDVKTGGYQAEYGRATGGVLNIVTRSGSNTFEGGASAFFTPNALRSDRGIAYQPGGSGVPGQVIYNDQAESSLSEGTLWASGPILKDRLFFFALVNPRDQDEWRAAVSSGSTAAAQVVGTQFRVQSDSPRWFTKFDLNLTDDHRIEASIFSDRAETEFQPYAYSRANGRGAELAGYVEESGGLNQIYKYTGVFSDRFTASALYGQVQSIYKDTGPAVSTPLIRDAVRGNILIGLGTGGTFDISGEDTRKTYRVDFDLYADLFGEHHLRFGYDREDLKSVANNASAGGGSFSLRRDVDFNGDGVNDDYARIRRFANNGTFEAEQTALYVQDSWTVSDQLTVQAGLRWDKYDYKNINGVTYAKIDDQIAPRLGFTFDPTGERTSRIYGSFGHYYLPIATNTSIRASSGEEFYDDYFAITRDASGAPVLGADGRPVLGARLAPRTYLSPPSAPDPRQVAEADLEPMYEREFILGYEKEFGFGWTLGLRYIDRDLASTIEDTAIGEAFVRYCVRTNTACAATEPGEGGATYTAADDPADFAALFPYVLFNPGDGARVFIDPDIAGPLAARYIDLTAADLAMTEVERTYKALEFTFERPFDGKWGVRGSYTLGKSEGNYEGAVKSDTGQTDSSITQDFDHYFNVPGSFGYLPNHRLHQLKVFGTYAITDSFQVGGNFRAESGRKYGCIGYSPDPTHAGTPPSAWYCPDGAGGRKLTPRGSQGETDFLTQLDLNLAYTHALPGRAGQIRASLDVFNVFDADSVTRVVEQGEVESGVKGQVAPFYGRPRTYQAPRTVRLGLQYKF